MVRDQNIYSFCVNSQITNITIITENATKLEELFEIRPNDPLYREKIIQKSRDYEDVFCPQHQDKIVNFLYSF